LLSAFRSSINPVPPFWAFVNFLKAQKAGIACRMGLGGGVGLIHAEKQNGVIPFTIRALITLSNYTNHLAETPLDDAFKAQA